MSKASFISSLIFFTIFVASISDYAQHNNFKIEVDKYLRWGNDPLNSKLYMNLKKEVVYSYVFKGDMPTSSMAQLYIIYSFKPLGLISDFLLKWLTHMCISPWLLIW